MPRLDRLKRLSKYLKRINKKFFDFLLYSTSSPDEKGRHKRGTAGCALGYATRIFYKDGLVLGKDQVPTFNKTYGLTAAKRFFDISDEEAKMLFGGYEYYYGVQSYEYYYGVQSYQVTPRMVAKKIDELVKRYEDGNV